MAGIQPSTAAALFDWTHSLLVRYPTAGSTASHWTGLLAHTSMRPTSEQLLGGDPYSVGVPNTGPISGRPYTWTAANSTPRIGSLGSRTRPLVSPSTQLSSPGIYPGTGIVSENINAIWLTGQPYSVLQLSLDHTTRLNTVGPETQNAFTDHNGLHSGKRLDFWTPHGSWPNRCTPSGM